MRILGVRHHSPACAGLVKRVIADSRPAWVLIEGPADFNDRLDELALHHELPIAIYSYSRAREGVCDQGACARSTGLRACWTPFCDYSPEWVALQAAREVGAKVLFMDLPGWSFAFENRENRYSDRHGPDLTKMALQLGFDDTDRLWDSLFEQPRDDLEEALGLYFEELRATLGEVATEDDAREGFMASSIAWAQAQGGEVVVVCGGYHAPVLKKAWPNAEPLPPQWEASAEVGNFLVPFTFGRLDSFAGYQSGMPSPEYHQRVWENGLCLAARQSLQDVARRLRAKKQNASSADLVVAHSMAQGLARLRGHQQVARTDLLDGLASALLTTALDVDLPWSRRGPLAPGSDPVLVEIVAAFSGERKGRLAAETPRPPLVIDVYATLQRLDLQPTIPARQLKLNALAERERSACLHRLLLLGIPGFKRQAGSSLATRGGLEEAWSLADLFERESALIEASSYGPDLEGACSAFLQDALAASEDAATVASLLSSALFAGLTTFSDKALAAIAQAIDRETDLGSLGQALTIILEIFAHDHLLGGKGKQELRRALEAGFTRGLWLFEGLRSEEQGGLHGVLALRDLHRQAPLDLPRELAIGLMGRAAQESDRAPSLQGAAVGYLWSCGAEAQGDWGSLALAHFAKLTPQHSADFLVGLLAVAREEVLEDLELVRGLDGQVREWTNQEFMQALPALRLAFTVLPPADKERLGRLLATLYGRTVGKDWFKLEVPPDVVARGHDLEDRIDRALEERKLR